VVPEVPPHLSRAESDAIGRRRRGRNLAILAVLIAVVVLFYLMAIVKMSHHGG
jgi:hypothetical protein